jgi:hypothetical protein
MASRIGVRLQAKAAKGVIVSALCLGQRVTSSGSVLLKALL